MPTPAAQRLNSRHQQTPAPATAAADGIMHAVLPGMQAAADAAPDIQLHHAGGLGRSQAAKGMRKANFTISRRGRPNHRADLPRRCRRQTGQHQSLARTDRSASNDRGRLSDIHRDDKFPHHRGCYVRLERRNARHSLGAFSPFHGTTWFFKMLGDRPPVVGASEDPSKHFSRASQMQPSPPLHEGPAQIFILPALTVVLLSLSMALIFFGTLDQVEYGIWHTQKDCISKVFWSCGAYPAKWYRLRSNRLAAHPDAGGLPARRHCCLSISSPRTSPASNDLEEEWIYAIHFGLITAADQ